MKNQICELRLLLEPPLSALFERTRAFSLRTGIGKAAALLCSVAALLVGAAVARGQSALDGFDPNPNGIVRVVVVQPDGKILIGGDFTALSPNGGAAVTRNHIARLNPDGTLDTAFDPNANGGVLAIALQMDGKILVGGSFNGASSIGGQMRNHLARLDPITGAADSFDPNANSFVLSITLEADGNILVGGGFQSIGGQLRNRIARLDTHSGLADSFDPNANDVVRAIAVQADGKILVGGDFFGANGIGGQPRNRIARVDPATGLADSFDPNANAQVLCLTLQADGKILAGGLFASIGGQTRNFIARLDPITGAADSFNPAPNGSVSTIAVQADGQILAGGTFTGANSIGGQARNRIARLSPLAGAADSFDPNASSTVIAIAVQPDGKILAGGNFINLAPSGGATVTRNRMGRLETDGRVDQTLMDLALTGTSGRYVSAIAVQPDGKILIGGPFQSVSGQSRQRLARLNTDGTVDSTFAFANPNDTVRAITIQADAKIILGGEFTQISVNGQPVVTRNHIARLNPNGTLDTAFDPGASGAVYSVALQANGKILVGGVFSGANSIGGQARDRLARLDPTTGLADSFNPAADGPVYSLALQADGKILVGGDYLSIGGQPRNFIARLDPTTGAADSFDPHPNGTVIAIAVQGDGEILAGGDFLFIGGQSRARLARLDPATGLADSFEPNANDFVGAIAIQADGKILAAGRFTTIGGQSRGYIARLDPTTGLADSFDPKPSFVTEVFSLALQADGKILAGGEFGSIGGQTRSGFARVSNDRAALQNLAVTQSSVTWTRGGSSVQFARVTFESSSDNVNYTALGNGTAAGSNWALTGLNLPTGQNLYIRARGDYNSGNLNGSGSIQEAVRNAFIPTSTPIPTPTATATATPRTSATPTATATATPTPSPGLVANVATRLPVGTGENVLIEGFIVQGLTGSTKKIMVRAIGPSLIPFGITDALANPTLEIHDASNAIVATNNNWKTTQIGGLIKGDQFAEINGSGLAPSNDLESAIIASLQPGSYTAVVRGVGNTVGTGVVDAYDLSAASPARLANVATRGLIQPGDKLMIAGLIIQNGPVQAVVRAVGPSLSAFGINNALPDTTLQVKDQNGTIVMENDDWQTTQKQELENTGLQPSHPLEAAVLVTLPPGQYTAQVRGKPERTGIGVVEVYFLQSP